MRNSCGRGAPSGITSIWRQNKPTSKTNSRERKTASNYSEKQDALSLQKSLLKKTGTRSTTHSRTGSANSREYISTEINQKSNYRNADRKILFFLNVTLQRGCSKSITFHEGDHCEDVAYDFCRKNTLSVEQYDDILACLKQRLFDISSEKVLDRISKSPPNPTPFPQKPQPSSKNPHKSTKNSQKTSSNPKRNLSSNNPKQKPTIFPSSELTNPILIQPLTMSYLAESTNNNKNVKNNRYFSTGIERRASTDRQLIEEMCHSADQSLDKQLDKLTRDTYQRASTLASSQGVYPVKNLQGSVYKSVLSQEGLDNNPSLRSSNSLKKLKKHLLKDQSSKELIPPPEEPLQDLQELYSSYNYSSLKDPQEKELELFYQSNPSSLYLPQSQNSGLKNVGERVSIKTELLKKMGPSGGKSSFLKKGSSRVGSRQASRQGSRAHSRQNSGRKRQSNISSLYHSHHHSPNSNDPLEEEYERSEQENSSHPPRYEQLYHLSKAIEKRKEELLEDELFRSCPFQPRTNSYNCDLTSLNFEQRLELDNKYRAEKMKRAEERNSRQNIRLKMIPETCKTLDRSYQRNPMLRRVTKSNPGPRHLQQTLLESSGEKRALKPLERRTDFFLQSRRQQKQIFDFFEANCGESDSFKNQRAVQFARL